MSWAQGVLTLDPAAPSAIKVVALVYKLHIVLGLTLFVITPFTRIVHVWRAPIWFLLRPGYQIVRSRSSKKRAYSPTQGPARGAPSYAGTTVPRPMSESGQEGAGPGNSMSQTLAHHRGSAGRRAPAPQQPTRPA